MTDRQRHGFVLLLVVGLIAASAVILTQFKTVLGLDLKGGVELVYQAQPTPQSQVTPTSLGRAVDIMRQRIDQLGVSEPEIQTYGGNQISVGLPERQGHHARDPASRHHGPARVLRLGGQRAAAQRANGRQPGAGTLAGCDRCPAQPGCVALRAAGSPLYQAVSLASKQPRSGQPGQRS